MTFSKVLSLPYETGYSEEKGGCVLSHKEKQNSADKLLEEYCRQYKEILYKYAYLRTGHDKAAAEDCIQDAFMVIYRRLRKGEEFAQPKAFLYRTVDNFIKEHLRNVKKQEKIKEELLITPESEEFNIFEHLDAKTENEIINAALNEMNDTEKIIYKRRYIENKNVREIAEEYKISISAVTTRLYRIRQKVENKVQQELKERGIFNG